MKASNLLLAGLLATAATFGLTSCSQDEPAVNSTSNYGVVTRDAAKINSNIKVFAYCDGCPTEQATPDQKGVYDAFNGRVQTYTSDSIQANVALITDRSVDYKHGSVEAIYKNGGKIVWTLPSKQVFENYVKAQDWLPGLASKIDWEGAEACTAIIFYNNNGTPAAVKYDNVLNPMSLNQCVDLVVSKLNGVNSRSNEFTMFNRNVYSWCDGKDGKSPAQGTVVFNAINGRNTGWNEGANIGIFTDESINEMSAKAYDIIYNKQGVIIWANPTKQNFDNFVNTQKWLNGVAEKANWKGEESCTAITIFVNGLGVLTVNSYDNYKSNVSLDEMVNQIVDDANRKTERN